MGFVLCLTLFSVYQAQACTRNEWSSWINDHKASTDPFSDELGEGPLLIGGGDRENMNKTAREVFCPAGHGSVTDIQCVPALVSGKNNTGHTSCDVYDGYECLNRHVDGNMCSDYKIRLNCNCTNPVTSTTTISTKTRLTSTTSKSITTTLKIASTMTSRSTTKSDSPTTIKPLVKLMTTSTASTASTKETSPSPKTTLSPTASRTSARATPPSPKTTLQATASITSKRAASPSPRTTLPSTKRTSVSRMREEPSVTPNKMRMRNKAAYYDGVILMTFISLVTTAVLLQ